MKRKVRVENNACFLFCAQKVEKTEKAAVDIVFFRYMCVATVLFRFTTCQLIVTHAFSVSFSCSQHAFSNLNVA